MSAYWISPFKMIHKFKLFPNLLNKSGSECKKLSLRACLCYDLLHFRGCPCTKYQFSLGAINRIHFFQHFWHCWIFQDAWESKLEIAYFFTITFLRIAIVDGPFFNKKKLKIRILYKCLMHFFKLQGFFWFLETSTIWSFGQLQHF